MLIDTPGQIEVFTWSASGTIITEALVGGHTHTQDAPWWLTAVFASHPAACLSFLQASSFPCVVMYVMDTSRSVNPVTFMSNMLYACRYVPSAVRTGEPFRCTSLTPPSLLPVSILYKTKLPFIVVMNKVSSLPVCALTCALSPSLT